MVVLVLLQYAEKFAVDLRLMFKPLLDLRNVRVGRAALLVALCVCVCVCVCVNVYTRVLAWNCAFLHVQERAIP